MVGEFRDDAQDRLLSTIPLLLEQRIPHSRPRVAAASELGALEDLLGGSRSAPGGRLDGLLLLPPPRHVVHVLAAELLGEPVVGRLARAIIIIAHRLRVGCVIVNVDCFAKFSW